MKVREEINKFADDKDKPILLFLLSRYHEEIEWKFVTKCIFEQYGKYYYQSNRVWIPKEEGIILYNFYNNKEE